MKLKLQPDTAISFEGSSNVYHVTYVDMIGPCPPGCTWDHDCYDEPYVAVTQKIGTAFPLSKLKHVFDSTGQGRLFNPAVDLTEE